MTSPQRAEQEAMKAQAFTAGEALALWRNYRGFPLDLQPERPESKRTEGAPKDPGHRSPPAIERRPLCAPDREFLAWLHVERFFIRCIKWRSSYPVLLMGKPTPCEMAFRDWYDQNPLQEPMTGTGQSWVKFWPELVSMSLSEAVIWHNEREENRHKQVTFEACKKAAQEGRLEAWQDPDDRMAWCCRPWDIERWAGVTRHGGRRVGAGRKAA